MKAKFFSIGLVLSSFVFFATAQETSQNEAGYKTAFKHSGIGENWFVNLGAGGQVFYGNNDAKSDVDYNDRISLLPEVSVGKWVNPYWAFRLKGQGGALRGFEPGTKLHVQHYDYLNAHFDALWNLANYWGAYSPDKVVSFGPYAGFGFAHFVKNKNSRPYHDSKGHDSNVPDGSDTHSNGLSINAGLNLGFNLSKRVNLNLDFGAEIFPDYFDVDLASRGAHLKNDVVMGISGGITFKLGKVGFEKVEPKDDALLNELNGKINALRAENAELSKRPDSCPECPKAPVVQTQAPVDQIQTPVVQTPDINYVPNVVLFRLNSYEIDANQQISVYNTAKFMENTGKSIKVVGYADRATGTSSYNMELSKKRARAVAKELITKYNIPSEKIIVEWKDSNKQPYPQNNWNRVVIMSVPN